jgi:hypothetical protein
MMDAKEAVGLLRMKDNGIFKIGLLADKSELIADFIQQQENAIAELTDDNGQQHIEIMLLNRKKSEREKYAELGRLAVNLHGYVCTNEGFGKWKECSDDCKFINFFQKRAELLAGEQDGQ